VHTVLSPALLPLIALALALAVAVRLRSPGRWGLLLYCLGLAAWATSLWLTVRPDTRPVGERLLMAGFLVPAGLVHAVLEDLDASDLLLPSLRIPGLRQLAIALAWTIALAFAAVGIWRPELFLSDAGRTPGPWFGLMFGAGAVLSSWPLLRLLYALRQAPSGARERLSYLLLAGILGTVGGGINVLQMLTGHPSPVGLYFALASLVLLAWVVQASRLPTFGRFVQHSLRYSVAAALLSTAFLFAVLVFLRPGDADLDASWDSFSGALLVFLVVLASQPLLGWLRGGLAGRFFPGQGDLDGMARALAESEARADHQGRLAELGTLAGAVAHEVRNPLGVIAAATRVLELQGAPPEPLAEIRDQVARASHFADELLEYGRPAPLNRRPIELHAAAELAASEVRRALDLDTRLDVEGPPASLDADLAMLIRAVGILVENAALAAGPTGTVRLRLAEAHQTVCLMVEDDGPGVPEAIADSLFQPFVSSRGRESGRAGTGLGLAIARGIAERHGGQLTYAGPSADLGGARFELTLPQIAPLPSGS